MPVNIWPQRAEKHAEMHLTGTIKIKTNLKNQRHEPQIQQKTTNIIKNDTIIKENTSIR